MEIVKIASNMKEARAVIHTILISYETPFAAYDIKKNEFLRTEKKFSQTTNKHINKWTEKIECKIMPQEFFEKLMENLK